MSIVVRKLIKRSVVISYLFHAHHFENHFTELKDLLEI